MRSFSRVARRGLLGVSLRSRGESSDHAQSEAHRLLGNDRILVETFAAQPELRAWCCRLPGVSFTLIPLFFFTATVLGALLALTAAEELADLHGIRITSEWADVVRVAARGFVYWLLPVMLSAYFAHLAYRHRLPLRWPMGAIALVSTLAALTHFDLTVDNGHGFIAAVVGLPTRRAAVRAVLTAMLVAFPLLLATRLSARGTVSEAVRGAASQTHTTSVSGPP